MQKFPGKKFFSFRKENEMKFPKNKLDFLDVTAKVASQREEVKDLIEAEPLLIMPLAIYTSALCDVFYPEEEDTKHETLDADTFKVKDTKFCMFERKDDIRLVIKKTNNIVADETFDNKVEALIAIIRYIEQCM